MPDYLSKDQAKNLGLDIEPVGGYLSPDQIQVLGLPDTIKEEPTLGGFVENVGKNVPVAWGQIVGGLKEMLPIYTLDYRTQKGQWGFGAGPFTTALAGMISKAIPGQFGKKPGAMEAEKIAEAMGTAIVSDIKEKIKHPLRYAYERPAEAALDIFGLSSLAKNLFPKSTAKMGKMLTPKQHPVQTAANELFGRITTKGPENFAQAGRPGFFKQLWGKTTGEELAQKAQAGLQAYLQKGKSEYRAGLERLKTVKGPVNFAPIGETLQDMLNSFEINYKHNGFKRLVQNTYSGKGAAQLRAADIKAVFGQSTLDEVAIPDILKATKTIHEWGTSREMLTARGMDILKRKLGNMISETDNGRAFVSQLYGATKKTLIDQFPEYREMMSKYSDMMDFKEQVGKALSIKDPAVRQTSVDTVLSKFTTAMREDRSFRRDLLSQLEQGPATNLTAEIAGYNLRPWMRPNFMQAAGGIGIMAAVTKEPWILAAITAASPRITATFLDTTRKLGQGAFKLSKIPVVKGAGATAFQLGRAGEQAQTERDKQISDMLDRLEAQTRRNNAGKAH